MPIRNYEKLKINQKGRINLPNNEMIFRVSGVYAIFLITSGSHLWESPAMREILYIPEILFNFFQTIVF